MRPQTTYWRRLARAAAVFAAFAPAASAWAADGGHSAGAGGHTAGAKPQRTDLLDLGAFRIRSTRAANLAITDVNFSLYLVLSSKCTAEDFHRLEQWRNRLRDQVITAVRSAEPADLAAPDLRRLQRLILYRVNRLPVAASVIGVYFSDFAVEESEDLSELYVPPITPTPQKQKSSGGH